MEAVATVGRTWPTTDGCEGLWGRIGREHTPPGGITCAWNAVTQLRHSKLTVYVRRSDNAYSAV